MCRSKYDKKVKVKNWPYKKPEILEEFQTEFD